MRQVASGMKSLVKHRCDEGILWPLEMMVVNPITLAETRGFQQERCSYHLAIFAPLKNKI